jgi:hypothetical protein
MSTLLEQASLVMIPSGYKEDVVYSQIPTDGSGDLSFTRASNGTRINSAGLVEVCPWNLLEQSQSFSTSGGAWNYTAGSGVTTGQTGYDGTTNAVLFTDSGANAVYGAYQSFSKLGAVTLSIYAKAGSTNIFNIDIFQTPLATVRVNLSTGAITSGSGTVESVGNGWYRISVTAVMTDTYYVRFGCPATGTVYIQNIQANIGATAKPYFPTTDRLNVPRLTYQNGGGGCPSLLLEKQSTNLNLYSQDLTNAAYPTGGSGGTVTTTANYGISPDGTQNATRIQISRTTGAGSYAEIYQRVSVTVGTTYTLSFYAKSLSGTPTLITTFNDGYFNEVTFSTDWVRYTYTFVATGAFGSGFNLLTYTPFTNTSASADLLVWGVQLEASSYPTSYIPTTSSSATRVADACFKTGISSLIGQTEGVIFADFNFIPHDSQVIVSIEDWVASSKVINIGSPSNTAITAQVFSGSNIFVGTFSSAVIGQRYKCALAYKASDFAFYVNGTQVATQSTGSVPACVNFNLGRFDPSQSSDNSYNQVALFKTRLSNSELASLTTI